MSQSEFSVPRSFVIVVDDDPAVRNSLKFALEIEGFTVRTYACPTELLDSTDVRLGHCFVVDQKMPGMIGFDLIGQLRARRISAPAILITSHPGTVLAERAASTDVAIVGKPLLGNALLDLIRAACARHTTTSHLKGNS